jgi:hypothetical protein
MQIEVNHEQETVFRDGAGNVIGYWVPASNGSTSNTIGAASDRELRRLLTECAQLRLKMDEVQTLCSKYEKENKMLSADLAEYIKRDIDDVKNHVSLEQLLQELQQGVE